METLQSNIIVNYLPQSMTDKELYSMFVTMGPIESYRVMKDHKTGYSYGFGFVNYVNPEHAAKAIQQLNGQEIYNKKIKVSYARASTDDIKETNLYICNVPRDYTDSDLETLFSPYGTIVQKTILRDKITKLSRGVAFVRFDRKEQGQAAIQALHGELPPGGTEPLSVRVASEHGKQKAAYYAGFNAAFELTQTNQRGGAVVNGQRGRGGNARSSNFQDAIADHFITQNSIARGFIARMSNPREFSARGSNPREFRARGSNPREFRARGFPPNGRGRTNSNLTYNNQYFANDDHITTPNLVSYPVRDTTAFGPYRQQRTHQRFHPVHFGSANNF